MKLKNIYQVGTKMNKDNKKFIIETLFLKEALKYNLTLKEFIFLMYFDNNYYLIFNIKKIYKIN